MNHTSRPLFLPAVVTMSAVLAACAPDRPTGPLRAAPDRALADKIDAVSVVSTEVIPFTPNDVLATIGTVNVFRGGFGSAIDKPEGGNTDFYSLTDRGPNIGGTGNDKLFVVPSFNPQIGRFHLENGTLVRREIITLRDAVGGPRTGLPVSGCGATGEIPKKLDGTLLPFDPNGIDSEGLRVMGDGTFWVSDEYGPFLTHFDRSGVTLEQNSPCSGPNPLPAVLVHRQPNKGMEGLAAVEGGNVLVGIVQNPLDNPTHAAIKNSSVLRIVVMDVQHHTSKQYVYLLDQPSYGASEIASVSPTTFLVDERDGKFLNDAVGGPSVQKKIYLIDITGATDISDPANSSSGLMLGGKTIDQMSAADLAANGIVPVRKVMMVVDLLAHGYTHDKAEGLVLLDGGQTVGVSNDDDFGVVDDGKGNLLQKFLPSGGVDHNELWLFHLNKSLKSIH
jgi:phytase-like protein